MNWNYFCLLIRFERRFPLKANRCLPGADYAIAMRFKISAVSN